MTCMEIWGGCDPADAAVSVPGLDAWVYSRPYQDAQPAPAQSEGGGDIYYVSSCATGRINRLLVADVAGHGSAVRHVAVSLRDMMRKYVNYLDQSRFVLAMNRQFTDSARAGAFATALVTTFFSPTRTLSVCNAGHPPPLVWRAATREWSLLETERDGQRVGNIPLGIMDLDECSEFDAELEVGDLVLVYTDSLTEARGPGGTMLGIAGVLATAQTNTDPAQPRSVIPDLLRAIDAQTRGGLRADDVTVLLLRATGTGDTIPLKQRLLAPFRILRAMGQSLLGKGPAALPDASLPNVGGAVIPVLNRLHKARGPTRK
jgi:serine phosphatase RsbU (regulator of sigma subunit)